MITIFLFGLFQLTELCHRAGYNAIQEFGGAARMVHMQHLEQALDTIKPLTTQDKIDFYEDYNTKLSAAVGCS